MTTIAYRDGVIATDSRASSSEWIASDSVKKLYRGSDGTIYAFSGALAECETVVKRLLAGAFLHEVEVSDQGRVVVLPLTGDLTVIEDKFKWTHPRDEFRAWGSGMPPARAALLMGAGAAEAVRIACMVDPGSGGEVVAMKSGG